MTPAQVEPKGSNMSKEHAFGTWFIWQELAMQREGEDQTYIDLELLDQDSHDIFEGLPEVCTRGRIKGFKSRVCRVESDDAYDATHDEDEARALALARARLIAAAPDLLEALRSTSDLLQAWIDSSPGPYDEAEDDIAALTKARAAIARATGGNQAMTQPGDTLTQREAGLIEEMIDLVADLARGNTEVETLEARAKKLIGRLP